MRVTFVGMAGTLSLAALDAACECSTVVAVLQAVPPSGRGARLRAMASRLPGLAHLDPLRQRAQSLGATFAPLTGTASSDDHATIAAHPADAIVVAGCPFLLADAVLARFPRAAINVHGALLPRHRGLLPYFWTYWHGDEAGGVTAHRMVGRADAGAILAQRAFPIPRGWPVDELNRAVGVIAGPVVADALAAAERGDPGRDQDEARATLAPFVRPGRATIPFAEWDTARVWHMLHGLDRYFHEPLRDANDRRIRYTSVGAWRAGTPDLVPGVVRCDGRAGTLACRDGVIDLLGVSLAP